LKSNPEADLQLISQKNSLVSTEPYSQSNLMLDEKTLCHFHRYRRIPTTMALADSIKVTDLKQNEMYAFIADQQTQGYGVASNSKWVSPLGNLYVTIVMSISKD
jgi:hypothetical protein